MYLAAYILYQAFEIRVMTSHNRCLHKHLMVRDLYVTDKTHA